MNAAAVRGTVAGAGCALLCLLVVAPAAATIAVDTCRQAQDQPRPRIEILPFTESSTTCGLSSEREVYGETCGLQGVDYGRADAVYRVRLNPGNRVGFLLREGSGADHVLALVRGCGEPTSGTNCVAASLDFIGSEDETIPARSYDPGVYHLFVDSAADANCGTYELSVAGTNPVPDLRLALSVTPQLQPGGPGELSTCPGEHRECVVAGRNVLYTLSLSNRGTLDASGVELHLSLPPEATAVPDPPAPCRRLAPRRLRCDLGALPIGATTEVTLEARVDPAARGIVTTTAQAVAVEGDPSPVASVDSRILAVTDLRLGKTARPDPVVAGCPLVYELGVDNLGPSTATAVVVTDTLPSGVEQSTGPPAPGCPLPAPGCAVPTIFPEDPAGEFDWEVGTLAPAAAVEVCVPVRVGPAAAGEVENRVGVRGAADEVELPAGSFRAVSTGVTRRTDLTITKEALGTAACLGEKSQDPACRALRGGSQTYRVTVGNLGPSDSSGATVEDELDSGVSFGSSPGACAPENGGVMCRVAPGAGQVETVQFTATVDPDRASRSFSNQARVTAADPDPKSDNDVSELVEIEIQADLRLADDGIVLQPSPVAAGENLLATLAVRNAGPSDAPAAEVRAVVSGPGVRLLASPDGCDSDDDAPGDDALTVTCDLAPIPRKGTDTARFVLQVPADAAAGELVVVNARPVANDKDPLPDNGTGRGETGIVTRADLAVDVTAPALVVTGEELVYGIVVSNRGPSDAAEVGLRSCLLPAVAVVDPLPPGCVEGPLPDVCPVEPSCAGRELCCSLAGLAANGEESLELTVEAPTEPGEVRNELVVVSSTPEPMSDPTPNTLTVTTPVVDPDRVVLALAVGDAADPVVAGDSVRYRVVVEHRGPADAPVSGLSVDLAVSGAEVADLMQKPAGCDEGDIPGALTCTLDDLAKGETAVLELLVPTAREAAGSVALAAEVLGADLDDPLTAEETTRLIAAPDLVLPFFLADAAPTGRATLFSVRRLASGSATIEVAYLSPDGTLLLDPRLHDLNDRQVYAVNVRDILAPDSGTETVSGFVAIDRPGAPGLPRERGLGGDVFRIDPANGSAGGLRLVDTASHRVPRQLCRRWSTRVPGGVLEGGSAFVFWTVPGRGGEVGQAADGPLVGRDYTQDGEFVHEFELTLDDQAFSDPGDEVLVSSGSVEWVFPQGVLGNVSAIHRTAQGGMVALPGVCLDARAASRQPGREHPLVVPYFEVDSSPGGATTVFTVGNETDGSIDVSADYYTPTGDPVCQSPQTFTLPSRAVRSFDLDHLGVDGNGALCDELSDGVGPPFAGYVKIRAFEAESADTVFLSGDYVRLLADSGPAAGDALVDTGQRLVPPGLCQGWLTRLIDGGAFGGTTEFVFYLPDASSSDPIGGTVYDERGDPLGHVSRENFDDVLVLDSRDLNVGEEGGSLFGSIEWTIPEPGGHVSTLYTTADGLAVLIPGACLDGDEP